MQIKPQKSTIADHLVLQPNTRVMGLPQSMRHDVTAREALQFHVDPFFPLSYRAAIAYADLRATVEPKTIRQWPSLGRFADDLRVSAVPGDEHLVQKRTAMIRSEIAESIDAQGDLFARNSIEYPWPKVRVLKRSAESAHDRPMIAIAGHRDRAVLGKQECYFEIGDSDVLLVWRTRRGHRHEMHMSDICTHGDLVSVVRRLKRQKSVARATVCFGDSRLTYFYQRQGNNFVPFAQLIEDSPGELAYFNTADRAHEEMTTRHFILVGPDFTPIDWIMLNPVASGMNDMSGSAVEFASFGDEKHRSRILESAITLFPEPSFSVAKAVGA